MNEWNDKADKLTKEGLLSNLILEVYEVTTSRMSTAPIWKNKSIENGLRTFVNLNTATMYESTWVDLNSIRTILDQRSESLNNNK